jgi:hypothetical protein
VDQFKEQELSNVVWAFAKLHHYEQGLFAHLLAAVKAKLPHFLPQVWEIRFWATDGASLGGLVAESLVVGSMCNSLACTAAVALQIMVHVEPSMLLPHLRTTISNCFITLAHPAGSVQHRMGAGNSRAPR